MFVVIRNQKQEVTRAYGSFVTFNEAIIWAESQSWAEKCNWYAIQVEQVQSDCAMPTSSNDEQDCC